MKLLIFLALLLPCVAYAEIVKCIDHGQVTYRNHSCSKVVQDNQKPVAQPTVHAPVIDRLPTVQPTDRASVFYRTPDQPNLTQPDSVSIVALPKFLSVKLKNGSYNVPGSVSGEPAVFQIDTGAFKTAISRRVADAAGVYDYACLNKLETATANGVVTVCMVTVNEITFGEFSVHDIQVMIMPDMQPEALLGMDVLQHYYIEQRDQALKISK